MAENSWREGVEKWSELLLGRSRVQPRLVFAEHSIWSPGAGLRSSAALTILAKVLGCVSLSFLICKTGMSQSSGKLMRYVLSP